LIELFSRRLVILNIIIRQDLTRVDIWEAEMFCPQCGAEIASDRIRFCTHCRFPVGSMKEFIATEASKNEAEEEKKFYPLRQRDITLGAALMFLGPIIALLLTSASRQPLAGVGFAIYIFSLSLLFSAFLLFSQLSPRQRGLTIGATLIFLGSVLSLPIGMRTDPPGALLIPILLMPIVLFWGRLMRALMRIYFYKEITPESGRCFRISIAASGGRDGC
jgi:hypothetical protein